MHPVLLAAAFLSALAIAADTVTTQFEDFIYGSPDRQAGWLSQGSTRQGATQFDHMVAPNVFGYPTFGRSVLRISNAVTSDSFADHTFSASVPEAGERDALGNTPGDGGRRTFVAQWDVAPTIWAHQPGLSVAVSPTRGGSERMSWIGMSDTQDGLAVRFVDYQDARPFGTRKNPGAGAGPEDYFVETEVAAGLDRTRPHTVTLEMFFREGPGNDIVRVYVDGELEHTGTSWEDYFRWKSPDGPMGATRTVSRLMFRTAGPAAPATFGQGFVFDNVRLSSRALPYARHRDEDRRGTRRGQQHERPRS